VLVGHTKMNHFILFLTTFLTPWCISYYF
jgi:hypothetical protein